MKKAVLIILMVFSVLLSGCVPKTNADRVIESLTVYSEDEVNAGMDTIEKYFRKNFRGCELKTIMYDEEFFEYELEYYSSMYDVSQDDIICLRIDFLWKDGSEDFRECILIRNQYDKWKVKECGYP